jgi:site-specific recombinase XerD
MIKRLRPPKVHVKDGRYYYVDKNKWKGLSRVNEGLRELYRRLAILTDQPPGNLLAMFVAYAEGPMLKLAPSTQKQYSYFFFGTATVEGILNHTFGHLMPAEVEPTLVAQFLEKSESGGGPAAGNRAKAALSSVFEFAMRKGWAKVNPCRGVRRNTERESKVRIERTSLVSALDRAPDHFALVMQFAYLTGVREIDIIKMTVAAVTPDGIRYVESKTKKPAWHPWTDVLRGLVREILEARHERMTRQYVNKYRKPRELPVHDRLFTNRFGKPLTMWGITSNMRRLETDGWSFRAIRPKAQTDGGDKNVIGHTGQMRERYTRERKLVPVR